MTSILLKSIPRYWKVVRAAVKRYGRQGLKPYSEPSLLGFKTPTGRVYAVTLDLIQDYYSNGESLTPEAIEAFIADGLTALNS